MNTEATVLRDGEKVRLDSAEIVPGDILLLQAGDKVAGDARLIRTANCKSTNRRLPANLFRPANTATPCRPTVPSPTAATWSTPPRWSPMGPATAVVVSTGDNTEIGHVYRLLSTTEVLATPLTRKITEFSRILLWVIVALAGFTFLIGCSAGRAGWTCSWLRRARGRRHPRRTSCRHHHHPGHRRRPHGETQRHHPEVARRRDARVHHDDLLGQDRHAHSEPDDRARHRRGHSRIQRHRARLPAGRILRTGERRLPARTNAAFQDCALAGVLANDSWLRETDAGWRVEGDPTEGALLVAGRNAGFTPSARNRCGARRCAIPLNPSISTWPPCTAP
jgi:cation-transporting P-type ATPase F